MSCPSCLASPLDERNSASRLISQQPTDHDLLPNRSAQQPSIGLDTAHEPFPLGLSFPQSINSNPTSSSMSSFANHPQQTSTLTMPKMIGTGMASTLDRSNFRQQPPPMKVRLDSSHPCVHEPLLSSFRRANRVNSRFIGMHRSVRSARPRVVHAIRKSLNVVILMFSLEIRISFLSLFYLCTNLSLSL